VEYYVYRVSRHIERKWNEEVDAQKREVRRAKNASAMIAIHHRDLILICSFSSKDRICAISIFGILINHMLWRTG
jgi:hypothetical protein